jgi:hypothetical protein
VQVEFIEKMELLRGNPVLLDRVLDSPVDARRRVLFCSCFGRRMSSSNNEAPIIAEPTAAGTHYSRTAVHLPERSSSVRQQSSSQLPAPLQYEKSQQQASAKPVAPTAIIGSDKVFEQEGIDIAATPTVEPIVQADESAGDLAVDEVAAVHPSADPYMTAIYKKAVEQWEAASVTSVRAARDPTVRAAAKRLGPAASAVLGSCIADVRKAESRGTHRKRRFSMANAVHMLITDTQSGGESRVVYPLETQAPAATVVAEPPRLRHEERKRDKLIKGVQAAVESLDSNPAMWTCGRIWTMRKFLLKVRFSEIMCACKYQIQANACPPLTVLGDESLLSAPVYQLLH